MNDGLEAEVYLCMTQSYKSMKTLTTIAGTLHKPKNPYLNGLSI